MKKTIILLFVLLVQLTAQAQLRSGHFFKTVQRENLTEQEAVERFGQWFALPQETEWQRVGERTDKLGMTRVEYRQYVSGVEVEHSQVLLHVRDGRVQTANGTVMEAAKAPAKIRRYAPVYRAGTPTDLLGRKLYLVSTKHGYRYAIKVLSTDRSEWIYTDADTDEVLKRIPTRNSLTAEPVKVTCSSLYSGEVQMDASRDTESGTYMLWDQQRNIHTMIGATLPAMEDLCDNGTFSEIFPSLGLPADEPLTWKEIDSMFDDGTLKPRDWDLSLYINKYASHAASATPTFDSYRFKTVTFDKVTFTDPESGDKTDFTPTEEDPQSVSLNIMYAGTDGMIEIMRDTITSMPVTFDLTQCMDEIPLAGADLQLCSVQYEYDKDGNPIRIKYVPLMTALRLVPDASCSKTWSNADVVASCVYEKNLPWSAVDIHWGMGHTYDFYREVFDRDSYDGQGSPIYNLFYLPMDSNDKIYLANIDMNNAAANTTFAKPFMIYGMGNRAIGKWSMNPVVELSVMSHEFTHIVTDSSAGLVYQGESGALNESFSDLMGICVKKYVQGNDAAWTIGEGVMVYCSNLRSMSFPKMCMDGAAACPDTYQGEFWVDPESKTDPDHGGVHTNSGVQNKWFYLLTDGDSGTNDKGYSYDITGIGIEKSRQIAYRTLTEYATQESQYADIRLASLQAATDLFGADAVEVTTVDEAWKAVGVVDGGDVTAIRNTRLATDGSMATDNAVYDLSGRKVQNPQKGLYIKSGKKILVSERLRNNKVQRSDFSSLR